MIELKCLRVGMLQTNCYIVFDSDRNEALITDPGDGAQHIISGLNELGLKPIAILLTHAHADHIQAIPELKEELNLPIYVNEGDVAMLANPAMNLGRKGIDLSAQDVVLKGGERLSLGGMEIDVIATPGHTPGGTCYYFKDAGFVLAGDTMFRCSWGRTDFPGGSERDLMKSIREKLLPLPAETIVYPGHEGATTIRNERAVHGYEE